SSVVQQTGAAPVIARLSSEPVMRIALATDVRSASVSTTAHLVNASEVTLIPLETSRVHVEARALSPRPPANTAFDIELARGVSREDADRLIESVKTKIGEEARAISPGANQWRVVISKPSREAVEV